MREPLVDTIREHLEAVNCVFDFLSEFFEKVLGELGALPWDESVKQKLQRRGGSSSLDDLHGDVT